jgi:predicted GIY-YIG superfamily endonuclease
MYGTDIIKMVNQSKEQSRRKAAPKLSRFFQESFPARAIIEPPAPPSPRAAIVESAPAADSPILSQGKTQVYILELQHGRVYVGSSKDVRRRIQQHSNGSGSAYTRAYKPTGVLLPRLGNIDGEGDAAERDETLRYMMLRGIPYVRGWKFTQVDMSLDDFDEAEANIRELFNLCRRCGYKGHFITQCKCTYDRWGNVCK